MDNCFFCIMKCTGQPLRVSLPALGARRNGGRHLRSPLDYSVSAPPALRPGDALDIAPHRRHRAEWTALLTPTVWPSYSEIHAGLCAMEPRGLAKHG